MFPLRGLKEAMGQRRVDKVSDLKPGHPAMDRFLKEAAKERVRRGHVGFTRKGRFGPGDATEQYGSAVQKGFQRGMNKKRK